MRVANLCDRKVKVNSEHAFGRATEVIVST